MPFTSIGSPGSTAEIESNFMTAFEVTEALVPSESATIGVLEIGTHSVPFNSLPLSHLTSSFFSLTVLSSWLLSEDSANPLLYG